MRLSDLPGPKKAWRRGVAALVVLVTVYYVPVILIIYVACGTIDVCRHKNRTPELLRKYFVGNGVFTWLLSPLNLCADLLSHRNIGVYSLAQLPQSHRSEIEACVSEFVAYGDRIKGHIAPELAANRRCMLTFKWFNAAQNVGLQIPDFERDYRYIRTIAVSAFNTREHTSRHFGPLRFTFRVLYNLEPIDSTDVFIEVDGKIHYWRDDPLFIFDDTLFHRSVNDVDHPRYCLFMDIIRPNYAQPAFEAAVFIVGLIAGWTKRIFYKHWSFIR